MAKKKSDSSVGYVEPGMTLIVGVKEGEWKELKQYRDESILYQLGTSCFTFALSIAVTLLAGEIQNKRNYAILCIALGVGLAAGAVLICFWLIERKKKNNVIKRVEGRAKEQYGNNIDL